MSKSLMNAKGYRRGDGLEAGNTDAMSVYILHVNAFIVPCVLYWAAWGKPSVLPVSVSGLPTLKLPFLFLEGRENLNSIHGGPTVENHATITINSKKIRTMIRNGKR